MKADLICDKCGWKKSINVYPGKFPAIGTKCESCGLPCIDKKDYLTIKFIWFVSLLNTVYVFIFRPKEKPVNIHMHRVGEDYKFERAVDAMTKKGNR